MNAVIPWTPLLRLIEPNYPQVGRSRQPLGLEKMLGTYFVQQGFTADDGSSCGETAAFILLEFAGVLFAQTRWNNHLVKSSALPSAGYLPRFSLFGGFVADQTELTRL